MDQNITIKGNLTRDPELRFTNSGTAVCDLGVAVNSRYQANGAWVDSVSFFNVVVWKQLGENAARSLKKGNRVTISGRMQSREYDTKTGDHRTVMELIAADVSVSLQFAVVEGITKTNTPAPVEEPVAA